MKFGDILRQLLEEKDMTQKELAMELNMGSTTIGNYIRNLREPDFETLKAFAAYFHVSTDYLLNFQSSTQRDHSEDELLHLYRQLPANQKKLFIEQGKLLVRMNNSERKSSSSISEKNNEAI